jgi:hypothetical protein
MISEFAYPHVTTADRATPIHAAFVNQVSVTLHQKILGSF